MPVGRLRSFPATAHTITDPRKNQVGIPGAVQAIQFLLRTEPDTPFVILQQAVDGIGNQIVIYGIGMRLFPIRPNTYKTFPVCSQPGIAG